MWCGMSAWWYPMWFGLSVWRYSMWCSMIVLWYLMRCGLSVWWYSMLCGTFVYSDIQCCVVCFMLIFCVVWYVCVMCFVLIFSVVWYVCMVLSTVVMILACSEKLSWGWCITMSWWNTKYSMAWESKMQCIVTPCNCGDFPCVAISWAVSG